MTDGLTQKGLFFLYHLLWTLAAAPVLPLAPLMRGGGLAERLGLRLAFADSGTRPIWVHALSVGEVLSALPLVKALRRRSPLTPLLFTATTLQGLETAQRELQPYEVNLRRMPLDFWWGIRRFLIRSNPSFLILIETDLWPSLLRLARGRGIKTVLVNGRISPRTFESYRRFPFFVRSLLFAHVDLCLMQSELDRERLLRIGIPPQRVITAGNIKFDRDWAPMDRREYDRWLNALGLSPADDVWVAGSTHQGEEEILLNVFSKLRTRFPQLRLILAPRKIEEGTRIRTMAQTKGLRAFLRTERTSGGESFDVLVLDTLGELGRVYAVAKVSFVGGSLVPIGGHNMLEPASFGRPVLFGPHVHNFALMSELLTEAGGGRMVRNGEELLQEMNALLSTPGKAMEMGARAKEFVETNRGALSRVMEHIEGLLET